MFIKRTHDLNAQRGTYLFPYVIGEVRPGRFWRPTDSESLTGHLPQDHIVNQLFAVNHRLGLVGRMFNHTHSIVETIEIADTFCINFDVKILDQHSDSGVPSEKHREKSWSGFEKILMHCFQLEVG